MPKTPKSKTPKARRKKGTGAIFQRGNLWYGRLRVNGEDRLTEGCATEDLAEKQLDRMVGGQVDPRFLPTLAGYWEMLLAPDGVFEHRYEVETANLYDTVLAKWIRKTALGEMRIDKIEKRHVQRHVDRMKKKLAPPTVRRYGGCIHVVLAEAVEDKLLQAKIENGQFLPANPATGIEYPVLDETIGYVHTDADLDEIPRLLYAYNPRLSAMWTCIADTGVRPGELCAMDTIDIDGDVWTIGKMRRHDGSLKDRTKAGNIRRVVLSVDCLAAIAAHGAKKGPVWLNEDGNPVRPDALYTHLQRFRKSLQKKWNDEAEKAGVDPDIVPPLRAKDLRITFATNGLKKSADPKMVQQTLGHKRLSTTTEVYARHDKDPNRDLIEALTKGRNRGLFADKAKDKSTKPVTYSRNSLDKPQAV